MTITGNWSLRKLAHLFKGYVAVEAIGRRRVGSHIILTCKSPPHDHTLWGSEINILETQGRQDGID